MIRRIGRRKWTVYAFDVENNNSVEAIQARETWVWLCSFLNEESREDSPGVFFSSIEEWLDYLGAMTKRVTHKGKRLVRNVMAYAYNLSHEWSFILPVLKERGFKWVPRCDGSEAGTFSSVTNKTAASVWSVDFCVNEGAVVEMRDLCKIFPGGLRNLAKSLKLPTQKGEMDYSLNRPRGWKATKEEKHYNFCDSKILMDVLVEMNRRDDRAFWRAKSAASYSAATMIAETYRREWNKMKAFRRDYPELGEEETAFLRKTVAGGITYPTPRFQFKKVTNVRHLDIHQAHPSSMAGHRFPYGFGEHHEGRPQRADRIAACHVKVSYTDVRLHSVISLIGEDVASGRELWLWDFEIEVMRLAYVNLQVTYLDYWEYHAKVLPWADYLRRNYKKRAKAKKEGDAFGILYYKLLNNSLYGKFEERGHDELLENVIAPDGTIDSVEHPNPRASLGGRYTYLPVGSCTAAYTRCFLIKSALALGWKNVVYFDTDSIFYIDNEESRKGEKSLKIGDKMGEWGREPDITVGEFSAAKRYKIQEGDALTVHMAGIHLGDLDALTFDDVDVEEGHYTTKTRLRVKGGTLIVDREKVLQIMPKYKRIYFANRDKMKEGSS